MPHPVSGNYEGMRGQYTTFLVPSHKNLGDADRMVQDEGYILVATHQRPGGDSNYYYTVFKPD